VSGETSLPRLLASLNPVLREGACVYVTDERLSTRALAFVREEEGPCWVVDQSEADELGAAYDFVGAWITMQVHSALEAVGLTAWISATLARAGISCNVIAGLRHDHIVVPFADRERAVALLQPRQRADGDPTVSLSPLDDEQQRARLPQVWRDYCESLLLAGESEASADANIDRNRSVVMRGDVLSSNNVMFDVLHGDTRVGMLWLARQGDESSTSWFVYDIAIEDKFQGRGLGRSTMLAAETYVQVHGGSSLSLNVFGYNDRARALYESLGYEEIARGMKKEFSGG